ncbi:unnamed protein product [Nezara viridula]|uniref:Uncharacterized protein n=1 Tax=Nezara viridula TaxID=85310 RepID=A0A9P0H3B6_NEZVI|nr:unnamed protein product [Nezara viridula]
MFSHHWGGKRFGIFVWEKVSRQKYSVGSDQVPWSLPFLTAPVLGAGWSEDERIAALLSVILHLRPDLIFSRPRSSEESQLLVPDVSLRSCSSGQLADVPCLQSNE